MDIPSPAEFERGYQAYQQHEKRDAMYRVATFLVEYFWKSPADVADSLGVLLLTWNQACYRYGSFDFDVLERCITSNLDLLNSYRGRDILSYGSADDRHIKHLFLQFLIALQIAEGKKKGTRSPVGVSKALHLLAPGFFPLWDTKIARAYRCYYAYKPDDKYLQFLRTIKQMADEIRPFVDVQETGKTLVKLIDEYNYAKYTWEWI